MDREDKEAILEFLADIVDTMVDMASAEEKYYSPITDLKVKLDELETKLKPVTGPICCPRCGCDHFTVPEYSGGEINCALCSHTMDFKY